MHETNGRSMKKIIGAIVIVTVFFICILQSFVGKDGNEVHLNLRNSTENNEALRPCLETECEGCIRPPHLVVSNTKNLVASEIESSQSVTTSVDGHELMFIPVGNKEVKEDSIKYPWVLRSREVRINKQVMAKKDFVLNPFPDQQYMVEPVQIKYELEGVQVLTGRIKNDFNETLGTASLVVSEINGQTGFAGRFRMNSGEFFILSRSSETNEVVVQEYKKNQGPPINCSNE